MLSTRFYLALKRLASLNPAHLATLLGPATLFPGPLTGADEGGGGQEAGCPEASDSVLPGSSV